MERPAPGRVTYSIGNEHNPTDPFGRTHLVLQPDGQARLDHFERFDRHRAWTGRVAPAALERLWAALEEAGFPNSAMHHPLPPDSAIATIAVEASGARAAVLLPTHGRSGRAGYDDALFVLDALVRQLSGQTAGRPMAGAPVWVDDVAGVD